MHTNDIIVDNVPIDGDFSKAWPKLVTAFLPDGETSQAIFYEDGIIEPLGGAEAAAPRTAS